MGVPLPNQGGGRGAIECSIFGSNDFDKQVAEHNSQSFKYLFQIFQYSDILESTGVGVPLPVVTEREKAASGGNLHLLHATHNHSHITIFTEIKYFFWTF